MEDIRALVAILAIIVGTFFSLVGVLGMVRLPDVYSRLHATGKVGIYGAVLLLVAAAVWTPLGWAVDGYRPRLGPCDCLSRLPDWPADEKRHT